STLQPIDQNTAMFYNRYVVDDNFGGLAFEEEGERCAGMMSDPAKKVMIMGNHGVLVAGDTVAQCFNRMYYFERAAETYIRALQTGQKLRVLSDEIAEKTAQELEDYPDQDDRHLAELRALLDAENSDYAS
ncbi:MAG: class II aldolase/adducin family protein, partial [Pseudomonadota bacterium]